MTLRPCEIRVVADEIARDLGGSRAKPVQKVIQPDPRTVALGFAGRWLLIRLDPRHGRIHLLDEKPPGTGEAAPPFCMLLRKELVGLALAAVETVEGERALGLVFSRGARQRRLLVFLYGAGARLVLLDGDGRPLGALPPAPSGAALLVELPPPRAAPDQPAAHPRFTGADPSRQIAAHYAAAEAAQAVAGARSRALAATRQEIARLRRREQALGDDLARADAAGDRRRHADLILAHLAEIPRGARDVVLADDLGDGAPVRIALDPARSPQAHAARLYREHKRLSRGRAVVEERLDATRAERARAEARLEAIERAGDAELAALASAASVASVEGRAPLRRSGQRPTRPRPPYRAFRSASGALILVGRGADRNDQLTFGVARGNDLWLHTRDVPGAHVVVPLAGRPVDETTLLDAATLALWFSPARPAEPLEASRAVQADVTYALRKFVRKPRGAAPGRVSVARGKTLRIRLEPERLRRLLASLADD